jgi:predicted Zn finger-like uncharacterized protein
LIIVCSECQAQYSVADAKIRGRKVRVTCKHCGNGIIVDGFALDAPPPPKPAPAPAPFETVPAIFDALRVAPEDDATRVMRKPQDFSVHDEPTVVGRIPQEALEAERRFAQSTVPPPKDGEPEAPPPMSVPAPTEPPESAAPVSGEEPAHIAPAPALSHGLPEALLDSTQAASPRAIAINRASLAPAPSSDPKPLVSRADPPPPAMWPWVLGAILIVIVLAALAIRH